MNVRFRFDLPAAEATLPTEVPAALRPARSDHRPASFDLLDPVPVDDVFVPDGYEPNYPYPLIVWALPSDASRLELQRLMGQVSYRNYLGLALRLSSAELSGIESGIDVDEVLAAAASRVEDLVVRMRRVHHVHTERIYLAGFDRAGSFALALGLSKPEWFAGLAAIGSAMPAVSHLLSRLDEVRGKRVFLGAGQSDRRVSPAEIGRVSRLLQSAGLRVCHRLYEAGHELTRPMLLELDRWVMKDIHETMSV